MFLDELCEKEVISICDCRKLGHVYNLEFDTCTGCICRITVKQKCGILGFFGGGEEITFSYSKIKQIGPDIVLVEL